MRRYSFITLLMSLLGSLPLLTSCATTHLERQAGAGTKAGCLSEARRHVQTNIQEIDPAWREYARYEEYQRCLARRAESNS